MRISTREIKPSTRALPNAFAAIVLAALAAIQTYGQAPALLWSTNIGARVIAANQVAPSDYYVFAQARNRVIKIDGVTGVPVQTNIVGPDVVFGYDVGLAQIDSDGNFYYAAIRPGAPTPWGYLYTNLPAYLLKFDAAGSLVWSNHFGPGPDLILNFVGIQSLNVSSGGNLYVGLSYNLSTTFGECNAYKFDAMGSNVWMTSLPRVGNTGGDIYLGPFSDTNGYFSTLTAVHGVAFGSLNPDGVASTIAGWGAASTFDCSGTIGNSLGEIFNVEQLQLVKRTATGSILWSKPVSHIRTVGADRYNGLHATDMNGVLYRHDYDGELAWQTNLGSPCNGLVLDSFGNRFLSTWDGRVMRLGNEVLLAPSITNAPKSRTVFAGTNVALTVGAAGTSPLRYYWLLNGLPLAGKTNATLSLGNSSPAQTGNYSVIVSNFIGAVTSAPALVTVKGVSLFLGNQMLTNGTYNFITPPTLSIASAFTNGSRYYTLDGSAPTFASTPYSGPFTVSNSATVRALGYSADFSLSEEADPANIVLLPSFPLTMTSTPGGNIALNPPGGTYQSNAVVTLTATPTNGWSFLYWQGDATGTSPSVNVTMNGAKSVHAVFGSTLSTTIAGNGQVSVYPPNGPYPYGSTVRLTAVPQPGNYFGVWGNAASGSANPLYFTLTNPGPTISSLFAPLAANQAALTVLINGPGTVQVSPSGNVFTTNQTVNITATPLAGHGFVNWSGDATGTENPVSVAMTQSRTVTANFTNWPVLVADHQSITPQGFRLTVLSGPGLTYQIQGSVNLGTWINLGVVTNTSGQSQFTDPSGTNLPMRFYRGTPWP